ncbi:MAG TPA: LysR family transcriptional regulator, partial [Pseudomonadota bacterium]|nr:LysR family transcriptional regulator [Pseudomonadota bacterium]
MQWDLLRTFEAVARLGSLSSAAKALGQSQSTVSRHIGKLEALSGSPLFLRTNPVKLTERGEALIQAVLPMVSASHEAALAIQDSPKLHGDVTLTTVGEILRWVLCRHLPSFYRDYPHLRLHILADNRVSSLAQGEADVALRLARPSRGELTARKLHTESYGFYAASSVNLHK